MWKFLSYTLSENLTAYKNGKRINIVEERKIVNGDSCNQTSLELPSHLGTHIDFPYHFDESGKKGDKFQANEFVFNSIDVIFLENMINGTSIIEEQHFNNYDFKQKTDLLIIKTGFCEERFNENYYNKYPGFSEKLAKYFKSKMPKLRAIGFDLISLSSPLNGGTGKKSHIEFLKEEKILIIEDMDLLNLNPGTKVNTVIVSPLRFENSDGAPVTIFYN
jgi:kynurenine formamidase